jgi:putative membrane protein
VLIFASAGERYAEIVADASINEKVDRHVWDDAINALLISP